MFKLLSSLSFTCIIILLTGCSKDKEPDYGFVDLRNTSWDIRGDFNGNNAVVIMRFNTRGVAEFGTISANWIQSGNEIMWLTADNRRFEARLKSSFEMRGNFYDGEGQLPLGSFTGRRRD